MRHMIMPKVAYKSAYAYAAKDVVEEYLVCYHENVNQVFDWREILRLMFRTEQESVIIFWSWIG